MARSGPSVREDEDGGEKAIRLRPWRFRRVTAGGDCLTAEQRSPAAAETKARARDASEIRSRRNANEITSSRISQTHNLKSPQMAFSV
ncbi:hypothetical protein Bca4012_088761 [Brassica carinata]|uniref:Uncharacterized protein n=1 Tax=Brassica carinata TaxID=52824 RepID=A0A8X7TMY7_BRACI|nr:hypothetical protein Bca52824_087623 [Brassica carinata]